MLNLSKKQSGMTLVETTIALGILMLGVLASLVLMWSTFKYAYKSEHEIVVVNLAREGIEIIRALRNNQGSDFFTNIFDQNSNFIVDSNNYFNLDHQADNSSANECQKCQLYQMSDARYLYDSSGQLSVYKRVIKLRSVSPAEIRVISEVGWNDKGENNSFLLETYLTNWIDPDSVKLFNAN